MLIKYIDLFDHALNMDGERKLMPEKMAKYYREHKHTRRFENPSEPFLFEIQSINFEAVDNKTFTDALYPNSIYDIIEFHLRECVKRETRLRLQSNSQVSQVKIKGTYIDSRWKI